MSARLTPERETEIRERADAATPGPWWTDILPEHGGECFGIDAPGDNWIVPFEDLRESDAEFMAHARQDVPALLAELAAVRAERDEARTQLAKYVGHEPTAADEMAYLSRCLHAVSALCDEAEKQAGRWEHPLPVPEWVEAVRRAIEVGAR